MAIRESPDLSEPYYYLSLLGHYLANIDITMRKELVDAIRRVHMAHFLGVGTIEITKGDITLTMEEGLYNLMPLGEKKLLMGAANSLDLAKDKLNKGSPFYTYDDTKEYKNRLSGLEAILSLKDKDSSSPIEEFFTSLRQKFNLADFKYRDIYKSRYDAFERDYKDLTGKRDENEKLRALLRKYAGDAGKTIEIVEMLKYLSRHMEIKKDRAKLLKLLNENEHYRHPIKEIFSIKADILKKIYGEIKSQPAEKQTKKGGVSKKNMTKSAREEAVILESKREKESKECALMRIDRLRFEALEAVQTFENLKSKKQPKKQIPKERPEIRALKKKLLSYYEIQSAPEKYRINTIIYLLENEFINTHILEKVLNQKGLAARSTRYFLNLFVANSKGAIVLDRRIGHLNYYRTTSSFEDYVAHFIQSLEENMAKSNEKEKRKQTNVIVFPCLGRFLKVSGYGYKRVMGFAGETVGEKIGALFTTFEKLQQKFPDWKRPLTIFALYIQTQDGYLSEVKTIDTKMNPGERLILELKERTTPISLEAAPPLAESPEETRKKVKKTQKQLFGPKAIIAKGVLGDKKKKAGKSKVVSQILDHILINGDSEFTTLLIGLAHDAKGRISSRSRTQIRIVTRKGKSFFITNIYSQVNPAWASLELIATGLTKVISLSDLNKQSSSPVAQSKVWFDEEARQWVVAWQNGGVKDNFATLWQARRQVFKVIYRLIEEYHRADSTRQSKIKREITAIRRGWVGSVAKQYALRNLQFKGWINTIISHYRQGRYGAAKGEIYNLLGNKKIGRQAHPFTHEPEFRMFKQRLGHAARLIREEKPGEAKPEIDFVSQNISRKLKESKAIYGFLVDFIKLHIEDNEKNKVSLDETFKKLFLARLKNKNHTRGSPVSSLSVQYWWLKYYQAVFISPKRHKPTFDAVDFYAKKPHLWAALQSFIDHQKTNFKKLTKEDKQDLTRAFIKTYESKEGFDIDLFNKACLGAFDLNYFASSPQEKNIISSPIMNKKQIRRLRGINKANIFIEGRVRIPPESLQPYVSNILRAGRYRMHRHQRLMSPDSLIFPSGKHEKRFSSPVRPSAPEENRRNFEAFISSVRNLDAAFQEGALAKILDFEIDQRQALLSVFENLESGIPSVQKLLKEKHLDEMKARLALFFQNCCGLITFEKTREILFALAYSSQEAEDVINLIRYHSALLNLVTCGETNIKGEDIDSLLKKIHTKKMIKTLRLVQLVDLSLLEGGLTEGVASGIEDFSKHLISYVRAKALKMLEFRTLKRHADVIAFLKDKRDDKALIQKTWDEFYENLKSSHVNFTPQEWDKLEEGGHRIVQWHFGQKRLNDIPYAIHEIETAWILVYEFGVRDIDEIIAGLQHDVAEDTDVSLETIRTIFGERVYVLVRLLTKPHEDLFGGDKNARDSAYLAMLLTGLDTSGRSNSYITRDETALIAAQRIKIADRIHNLSSLSYAKPEFRRKVIFGTLDSFIPDFVFNAKVPLFIKQRLYLQFIGTSQRLGMLDEYNRINESEFKLCFKEQKGRYLRASSLQEYQALVDRIIKLSKGSLASSPVSGVGVLILTEMPTSVHHEKKTVSSPIGKLFPFQSGKWVINQRLQAASSSPINLVEWYGSKKLAVQKILEKRFGKTVKPEDLLAYSELGALYLMIRPISDPVKYLGAILSGIILASGYSAHSVDLSILVFLLTYNFGGFLRGIITFFFAKKRPQTRFTIIKLLTVWPFIGGNTAIFIQLGVSYKDLLKERFARWGQRILKLFGYKSRPSHSSMTEHTYTTYVEIARNGWVPQGIGTYAAGNPEYRAWMIRNIGTGNKVFSAGCGRGELDLAIVEAGNRVVAIDIVPEMVAAAKKRGLENVFVADMHNLPKNLTKDKYDIVLFSESIGNMDILSALTQASLILKDKGRLIITTYPPIPSHKHSDLYRRINRGELGRIVKTAGFIILRSEDFFWPSYKLPGHLIYLEARKGIEKEKSGASSPVVSEPIKFSFSIVAHFHRWGDEGELPVAQDSFWNGILGGGVPAYDSVSIWNAFWPIIEGLKENFGKLRNIKILELGAGFGQLLEYLKKEEKAKVYGIEPSLVAAKAAQDRRINVKQGWVKDTPVLFKNEAFDAVVSSRVFEPTGLNGEHIAVNIIREINQRLKNEGLHVHAAADTIYLKPFHPSFGLQLLKHISREELIPSIFRHLIVAKKLAASPVIVDGIAIEIEDLATKIINNHDTQDNVAALCDLLLRASLNSISYESEELTSYLDPARYPPAFKYLQGALKEGKSKGVYNLLTNELLRRIKSFQHNLDRDNLILALWVLNLAYIRAVFRRKMVSDDSLLVDTYEELLRCIEKFKLDGKGRFISYYSRRVRWAIPRWLGRERAPIRIPAGYAKENRLKLPQPQAELLEDIGVIKGSLHEWWQKVKPGVEIILGKGSIRYFDAEILKDVFSEVSDCRFSSSKTLSLAKLKEKYPNLKDKYILSRDFIRPLYLLYIAYNIFINRKPQTKISRELNMSNNTVNTYYLTEILPRIASRKNGFSVAYTRRKMSVNAKKIAAEKIVAVSLWKDFLLGKSAETPPMLKRKLHYNGIFKLFRTRLYCPAEVVRFGSAINVGVERKDGNPTIIIYDQDIDKKGYAFCRWDEKNEKLTSINGKDDIKITVYRKSLSRQYKDYIRALWENGENGENGFFQQGWVGLMTNRWGRAYCSVLSKKIPLNLPNAGYLMRIVGVINTVSERAIIAMFKPNESIDYSEYKKITLLEGNKISCRWGKVKIDTEKNRGIFYINGDNGDYVDFIPISQEANTANCAPQTKITAASPVREDKKVPSGKAKEEFLREYTPYIREIIKILDKYRVNGIITRYFLTGSLARGDFNKVPAKDIDIWICLNREIVKDVTSFEIEIFNKLPRKNELELDIILYPFGRVYKIEEDRILFSGEFIDEQRTVKNEKLYGKECRLIELTDIYEEIMLNSEFFVNLYRKIIGHNNEITTTASPMTNTAHSVERIVYSENYPDSYTLSDI